jgi:GNAT superfamily N-acetyltransferase
MTADTILWKLRPAGATDLRQVNRLIETAIDTWRLPARVKRLSKPVYLYSKYDLDFLELVVAEANDGNIIGVAAWEQAEPHDAPAGRSALLLHGIYVAPDHHRKGVGTRLFETAEKAACSRGLDGVLVKAQPGAQEFFFALGLDRVPVEDQRRDYPHRFWKSVSVSDAAHGGCGRHWFRDTG